MADFSTLGPNQMLSKDIIIITCDGQKEIRAFYHFAFFAFVLSDDTRSVAVAGPAFGFKPRTLARQLWWFICDLAIKLNLLL